MKIVARILLVIWAFVMVQPAFAFFGGKSAYGKCVEATPSKSACTKEKPADTGCSKKKAAKSVCTKGKCNSSSKSSDKSDCRTEGCNPSLGCSSGNYYVHHHAEISVLSWFSQKQKAVVTDDNRILKNMSECWHPPEA